VRPRHLRRFSFMPDEDHGLSVIIDRPAGYSRPSEVNSPGAICRCGWSYAIQSAWVAVFSGSVLRNRIIVKSTSRQIRRKMQVRDCLIRLCTSDPP
jgi:hypothetical protein